MELMHFMGGHTELVEVFGRPSHTLRQAQGDCTHFLILIYKSNSV